MRDTNSRQQAWAKLRAAVDANVRAAYPIGPGAVVSVVLTLFERAEQFTLAEMTVIEAQLAALEASMRKDRHKSGKRPSRDGRRAHRA